jgi:hypothetical protein
MEREEKEEEKEGGERGRKDLVICCEDREFDFLKRTINSINSS